MFPETRPSDIIRKFTMKVRRPRLMDSALQAVDHRPWPLPRRPWILRMSWRDLAFVHYPIAADQLSAFLPAGVRLDQFGGTAWIGIVPFRMVDVLPRPLPAFPFFTTFPEVNLRTYVEVGGKPGVWFFSLDADSWPTVFGGRRCFSLPYHSARIRLIRQDGWFRCSSERRDGRAVFHGRYRGIGNVFAAARGTFEHWATERYCLYAHSPRAGLARLEVHHPPWPLQRAEVEIDACSLLTAAGIAPLDAPPVCHFSAGVPVLAFGRESLPRGDA